MSDSLLIEQRHRWEQGERIPVETYLERRPGLRAEADLVLDLIEHEIVLRQEHGETPQLDEYLQRFPELARDLRLHFEVHAALQAEPAPAPTLPQKHVPSADWSALPGYEVLGELGRGGMGVVYRARQVALNRVVAVKMILAGPHAGPQELARFRREAETVARLQHPNIVQIYEVGEVAGRPYLALEYVDGGSLDRLAAGTPQPAEAAAPLAEALARAIHYAHECGVIHRDLKPANILLQDQETRRQGDKEKEPVPSLSLSPGLLVSFSPKITDFGLAKLLGAGAAGPTQSGDLLGTPSYMAPEQTEGKTAAIGPAADIYALGAILYELLTGRPPFRAESVLETLMQVRSQEPVSPSRLQPKLPRDLVTICLTCLHKDPGKRYPSALALAADLHRFREGQPIQARPIGSAERAVKWVRRRPAVAGLLAAIAAMAVLGVAGVVWQWRQTVAALEQTQQAHEETMAQLYLNQVARAQHELRAHHAGRAEHLLDETSPTLRGWEWHYLKRLCQTDLWTLHGHRGEVQKVAYSPDGQLLASGSGNWYRGRDGDLKVWDARTGHVLQTLTRDIGTVYAVAFSPDSRLLASGSADRTVRLWNPRTGQLLHALPGHTQPVTCVAFHPDGRRLASGSTDHTVRLWDVGTGQPLHTWEEHRDSVWSVVFSQDGRYLASAGRDGRAYLRDLVHATPVRPLRGLRDLRAAAFSPDGTWLAVGCYAGPIWLWDVTQPNTPPVVHHPNAGAVGDLAFSPDGRRLAWSSGNGSVKIRDVRTGQDLMAFRGHNGHVLSLAFSPDGRSLVTGGVDRTVRLWDATAEEEYSRSMDASETLLGLSYGPEGRLLALGYVRGGTVRIWDGATGKALVSLPKQSVPLQGAASSPDGRALAWVGDDQALRVWDLPAQQAAWTQTLRAGPVTGVAYSPDSRQLAWGGADGSVRLCDAATGQEVDTLDPHGSAVTGVAFHPDGQFLATAGQDGTFRIWDLTLRKAVTQFGGTVRDGDGEAAPEREATLPATATVTRLAYSPEGRRLAAANGRRPLEIWDITTGRVALALEGRSFGAVAWSPDGQRLAATYGREVVVLDAAAQEREVRQRLAADRARAWHEREARSGAAGRHWFAAVFHGNQLVVADPDNASYRDNRGFALAELGQWDRAAADFATAADQQPNNVNLWYRRAAAHLGGDNRPGHRAACSAMFAHFRQTENAGVAGPVVYACVAAPQAVPDSAALVNLAQLGARAAAGGKRVLGAALCRAGRYDEAQQRLHEAGAQGWRFRAWDWLFLALAHHGRGETAKAQEVLARAVAWIDAANQPAPGGVDAGRPTWYGWWERVEVQALRRETEALLHGAKP